MPIIQGDVEQLNAGHFGYSAVRMDTLDESMYSLATLVIDCSSSVNRFMPDIIKVLKEAVKAVGNPKFNPRSDNVLLRVVTFATTVREVHGFVPINQITDLSVYDSINASGATALFDATISSIEASTDMGKRLHDNRYTANGIVIVVTDGMNCAGRFKDLSDVVEVGKAFEKANQKECLESLDSFLIGVNVGQDREIIQALNDLHAQGFTRPFVKIEEANEKTIAKLGLAISESISASSQAVGTGGPSQAVSQNLSF